MSADDEIDRVEALGTVLDQGRGSLPFALVHGEALVACAAWALGEAGVVPVDLGTSWEAVVDADEPYVLHDPLCPLTPASFVAACVRAAEESGEVAVGVDPDSGEVWSPLVLPTRVVADLSTSPDQVPALDLGELVAELRLRYPVRELPAPAAARRVRDAAGLAALEALTRPLED